MKRTLAHVALSLTILLLAGCEAATVGFFGGIIVAGNALQPSREKFTVEQQDRYREEFYRKEAEKNRR